MFKTHLSLRIILGLLISSSIHTSYSFGVNKVVMEVKRTLKSKPTSPPLSDVLPPTTEDIIYQAVAEKFGADEAAIFTPGMTEYQKGVYRRQLIRQHVESITEHVHEKAASLKGYDTALDAGNIADQKKWREKIDYHDYQIELHKQAVTYHSSHLDEHIQNHVNEVFEERKRKRKSN